MKKNILILIAVVLFLVSCISDKTVISTIDDTSKAQLKEASLYLTKYKFTYSNEALKNAKNIIKELEKRAEGNKYFEAKIFALYGELALIKENKSEYKELIYEMETRNKREETVFILKAELLKTTKDKIKYINGIIHSKKSDENKKLYLYLANLLFLEGKFSEAVASFDKVIPTLPGSVGKYYKKYRELSISFLSNPPNSKNTIPLLLKNAMTTQDIINITLQESNFITIVNKDEKIKKIFDKLANDNYFFNLSESNVSLKSTISRKDIAFFLLHIVADLEKDSSLYRKYIDEFSYDDEEDSPIPDVPTTAYFYNAVLVLVEREILDLPDGENFFPNNTMSPMDYYKIIMELKKIYL